MEELELNTADAKRAIKLLKDEGFNVRVARIDALGWVTIIAVDRVDEAVELFEKNKIELV